MKNDFTTVTAYIFDADRKEERNYTTQAEVIRAFLEGKPHMALSDISAATGFPEPSVSAQMRSLRTSKFGNRVVDRRFASAAGKYVYKLMPNDA